MTEIVKWDHYGSSDAVHFRSLYNNPVGRAISGASGRILLYVRTNFYLYTIQVHTIKSHHSRN